MGVKASEDTYRQVKALLGIPEDEPIFILRAQDELSESLVTKYGMDYRKTAERRNKQANPESPRLTPEQKEFSTAVGIRADEFWDWQERNDEKVKFPD